MRRWMTETLILFLLGIGLVLLAGCSFSSPLKGDAGGATVMVRGEEEVTAEAASTQARTIFVHVCGFVKHPGVYELSPDARADAAIAAAGGFTKEADENAWNLAAPLEDGMQIYIPDEDSAAREGQAANVAGSAGAGGENGSKVNINTATKEELMTLSGIGESRAEEILRTRQERGAFASIEEIKEVSGIGDGIFDRIKDSITVN